MDQEYICYCFKHTRKALEEDVKKHGRSLIMEQIVNDSKAGNCHCKTESPTGR